MLPDSSALARKTVPIAITDMVRCTPLIHKDTPLGMGYGKTRFASPYDKFRLLYLGCDLATALAETIVRDRFEGQSTRMLHLTDITSWGACEVRSSAPMRLLDLRGDGCFHLGISTDIVGAKAQDPSRQFSQHVYDNTSVDGIIYESRLLKRLCIAVYDRARESLQAGAVQPVQQLAGLVPALQELQVSLIA
jgi:hypothetical protein